MKKVWVLVFSAFLVLPMALNSRTTEAAAAPDGTIDILVFMIERYADGVNIIWKVAHQGEVEIYYLQHSTNQLDWTTIAEIQPILGEEYDAQDYFHANLADGTHYYRLVARMVSGQEEISKAVVYHLNVDAIGSLGSGSGGISSPAVVTFGNTLSLNSGETTGDTVVHDEEGNVVLVVPSGIAVDLTHLKPGVYFLRDTESGGVRGVIKQ
ncbi:MAG: hypothetical protein R3330_09020 [Saprospiraceae bacterium]|nr:hypothetical protein [Saprospiraceae bacterium]